ncbi:MAG: MoxR family ATPase [Clostridia bacterium]|nr:MoxR family ATPase [Clostridia bacterium]
MHPEVKAIVDLLERQRYVADRALATTIHLAARLGKPVLIEGEAGVGKTEVAKALAAALGTDLVRLQCYEGLDAASALYEWNYPRQLLRIRLEEGGGRSVEEREAVIFSEAYLLKRPILDAISREDRAPVLLIDEVDRADEEFEAFLLEVLSDFQVTIPELGTVRARHRPFVVLTSNRTRALSDALRRRCLYVWIPYPSLEKELAVVRMRVAGIRPRLAAQVTAAVQLLRRRPLNKVPGVAETLDWGAALTSLGLEELEAEVAADTIGCALKDVEDIEAVAGAPLEAIVAAARAVGGDGDGWDPAWIRSVQARLAATRV